MRAVGGGPVGSVFQVEVPNYDTTQPGGPGLDDLHALLEPRDWQGPDYAAQADSVIERILKEYQEKSDAASEAEGQTEGETPAERPKSRVVDIRVEPAGKSSPSDWLNLSCPDGVLL